VGQGGLVQKICNTGYPWERFLKWEFVAENYRIWGGADLKLFFAKVQNRPKVMAKIIKNYVRNIFSKTLYVPYLNQKCSDFVQMLCKGLL
jgi:hypothetical protein